MLRNPYDLMLVGGVALLTLALNLLGLALPIVQVVTGLALVLVFPGYAVVAALFPEQTLLGTERAALVLGLSVGITIVCGFVLNFVRLELVRSSWSIALSLVTCVACGIALVRRERFHRPRFPARLILPWSRKQAALFVVAAGLVAGALLLARHEAIRQPPADVIQLWMLPGNAANEVRIGVASAGETGGTFELRLVNDGRIIHDWPSVEIAPHTTWEQRFAWQQPLAQREPLEALLYRAGEPQTPYRRVIFWPDQQR